MIKSNQGIVTCFLKTSAFKGCESKNNWNMTVNSRHERQLTGACVLNVGCWMGCWDDY